MHPLGPRKTGQAGERAFRRRARACTEAMRAQIGPGRPARGIAYAALCVLAVVGAVTVADSPQPSSAPAVEGKAEQQRLNPTASRGTERLSPEDIGILLQHLADPRWQVRTKATQRLVQAGSHIFPRLLEAFRATQQHEARLRIKEIAEEVFVRERMDSGEGFLGIKQRPVTTLTDARVPEGRIGILVASVVPKSAADQAGLETGDVIIRFNGKPIPTDDQDPSRRALINPANPGNAFSQAVRRVRAGTTVAMDVLRANQLVRLQTTLTSRPARHWDQPEVRKAHTAFNRWWAQTLEISDGRRYDSEAR